MVTITYSKRNIEIPLFQYITTQQRHMIRIGDSLSSNTAKLAVFIIYVLKWLYDFK